MADDIASGATYLAYQYGDAEKLRIRYETHRRYSVVPDNFREWVIAQCNIAPELRVLDVGCGPGAYHAPLAALGARIVACDFSAGMAAEAHGGARDAGIDVALMQAWAEALPFADRSFDRVMANHMVYHVPDIPLALSEMRRVLRPGGRATLTTNSASPGRIFELHERAARACGFKPTPIASARFTLDDLPLVHSVFPEARVMVKENAFAFPATDAVLRYYASYQVDEIEEREGDGSHRPPLLRAMRQLIDDVIAQEGAFITPKTAGCFVADA